MGRLSRNLKIEDGLSLLSECITIKDEVCLNDQDSTRGHKSERREAFLFRRYWLVKITSFGT
jgi:hypothetical protein